MRPLLLLLALVVGCSTSLPPRSTLLPGDYVQDLAARDGWFHRSYRVHVPPQLGEDRPLALVVVLHGEGGDAKRMERHSGFDAVADREGFLAVYPQGYSRWGLGADWNSGHCCGAAFEQRIDHRTALDQLLDDVAGRLPVDSSRIYLVGESSGAMLVYRYAILRSERVAGAAAVNGALNSSPIDGAGDILADPKVPVPIVILHGSDDRWIPFEGGSGPLEPDRAWSSVGVAAAFWVERNHARTRPQVESLFGGRVVRTRWPATGGRSAPVSLYEIRQWGHAWPGPATTALPEGTEPLPDFDAAEIVWHQLSPHRRIPPATRPAGASGRKR